MKKKFFPRVVAFATTLALCMPMMPTMVSEAEEMFSYSLSVDQKFYYAVLSDTCTDTQFSDLPTVNENKPISYENTFADAANKDSITDIDIPNTDLEHEPNFAMTRMSALENLTIRHTGKIELYFTRASNLKTITLYTSGLDLGSTTSSGVSSECQWTVPTDEVKDTIVAVFDNADYVTVDSSLLVPEKQDGELEISSDVTEQYYGEDFIQIQVKKNTNEGNEVTFGIYTNPDCTIPARNVTFDTKTADVSKLEPGTYYIRASVLGTDQYNAAVSNIISITIKGLEKDRLTTLVEEARVLMNQSASEERAFLQDFLYEINAILIGDLPEVTQNDVDAACERLQATIALVEARNLWNAAIDKINDSLQDEDVYTDESYKDFADVIEEYKTGISEGTATVSTIEALIEKLNSAFEALEVYDLTEDKATLDALVKRAEALTISAYTAESYKAVADALAEIAKLPENATKTPIKEAIQKLDAALNALVKETTTPQPTPGTGGGGTIETPKPVTPPTVAKVKKLKAKAQKGKKIKVTWKKVKGVTGYKIRIATNKKFKKAKVITVKKASYVIKKFKGKKLKKGTKYYISVQAYATYKDGNETKTVNGKIVKLKKPLKIK